MMEKARTSETLVNFYQTTRRYNPEDSQLDTHRCEYLKSYILDSYSGGIFSNLFLFGIPIFLTEDLLSLLSTFRLTLV
jgi:hypothetical protein